MRTAERVIALLGLERLPFEGGWFRETYRAAGGITLEREAQGGVGPVGRRAFSTQIYYLLRRGETSALHRVRSDEVFHHYLGDPVVQLRIDDGTRTHGTAPAGTTTSETVILGADLEAGHRPQAVVPAHVWQGATLGEGDRGYALLGCTVAPGFDWADFELITRDRARVLGEALPGTRGLIETLTPAEGRTRA
jgi:predicted cupin superfamily sugar epimerase